MSPLERRYRGLLRVLPGWYRAQREDEMVTTFLAGRRDRDDRVLGWPGWPEARAVLSLAVTTRVAARHGPQRSVALGRILRLAALLGLVALVPRAVAGVADVLGAPELVLRLEYALYDLVALAHVLTSACLVLLVTGYRRPARSSAVAAIAVTAVTLLLSLLPNAAVLGATEPLRTVTLYLPVWVAAGSMLIAFTGQAPAPPARPWLIAGVAAVAVTVAWMAIRSTIANGSFTPVLSDLGSSSGWAVLVAAVALPLLRRRLSDLAMWASALALTAAALLPDRLNYLDLARQVSTFDGVDGPLVATTIQAAGLAAATLALSAIGIHHYRRLPPYADALT